MNFNEQNIFLTYEKFQSVIQLERKWHKFDWDKNAISPIFGWDLKTSQEGAKDIWAVSVQPVDIIFDLETLNSGQKSKILQIPDGTLKRLTGQQH
jgi:hypothetical protein